MGSGVPYGGGSAPYTGLAHSSGGSRPRPSSAPSLQLSPSTALPFSYAPSVHLPRRQPEPLAELRRVHALQGPLRRRQRLAQRRRGQARVLVDGIQRGGVGDPLLHPWHPGDHLADSKQRRHTVLHGPGRQLQRSGLRHSGGRGVRASLRAARRPVFHIGRVEEDLPVRWMGARDLALGSNATKTCREWLF